ncbi:MAG: DUF444 family protein [Candidatus Nanohaloarchaea archaeon]|nr:DUF444 family protein [Candidatus Nanohaloarchaea archaeon]
MRSDRIRRDRDRFMEIGEEEREDLADWIQYGDMSDMIPEDDYASVPIKVAELPEFAYDQSDEPRVGKGGGEGEGGQPEPGDIDPNAQPEDGEGDGDGDEPGEPGEEEGEHEQYEMDPEEFADELDDELDLDLDPKGKKVEEEIEGGWNRIEQKGTDANIDWKRSLMEQKKRSLAIDYDENFAREALKVEDVGPEDVFEYMTTRFQDNVSQRELEVMLEQELEDEDLDVYDDFDELEDEVEHRTPNQLPQTETTSMRDDDKRFRKPEMIKEEQKNVVVTNIRDVSGSMREEKRDLVERVFTTLDYYLKGKYDNAEFVYIAHDYEAEEVEAVEFFGMSSGGGTRISAGYEEAKKILEERYDWDEWNRYVFAAGDGENTRDDFENVVELMNDMPANLHAYLQTQPSGGGYTPQGGYHAEKLEDAKENGELEYDTAIARVDSQDEVLDGVETILSEEDQG